MKYRLLAKDEHIETKQLWEEVFSDDTEKFLDYYYNHMADHNYIYVMEEGDEPVSMLQLNPYMMSVCNEIYLLHYIVAVSTRESYRGRGLMRTLLHKSFQDMYERKELFTYLMPAKEAIYEPFDFVTISEQTHYEISKETFLLDLKSKIPNCTIEEAEISDYEALESFTDTVLGQKYEIYTMHTATYFEQLAKEQSCQNGGIYIIKREGELLGYFLLADEGYCQVRELVTSVELDLELKVKDEPKIMVRVIHAESFLNVLCENENEPIHIIDEIIAENTGVFERDETGVYRKTLKNIDEEKAISVAHLVQERFEKQNILINEIV